MPTISERENLMTSNLPRYSGFSPRSVQKLATIKKPRSALDIECRHFLRTSSDSFTHGHPSLDFRLWKEAGKHAGIFPQKPDPEYNSNVWRNFRQQYGLKTTADGRKISEVIATMYPLNIPTPSLVGEHTFEKYVRESKLFESEKYKTLAIQRTRRDVDEFKRLRMKSEARNPPLDESGNILPPEQFQKYENGFVPVASPPPTPPPTDMKTDMFGRQYVSKSKPHLFKLTAKMNAPKYDEIREILSKQRGPERSHQPWNKMRLIPPAPEDKNRYDR